MQLEVNASFVEENNTVNIPGGTVMITPPLNEGYWMARVKVSEEQAVVCFPKFGTIGIGFQHEEDWNTNLPYGCDAEKIFDHIAHNKGDDNISDELCIQAIETLRAFAREYKQAWIQEQGL
jgi:hypothetical protein